MGEGPIALHLETLDRVLIRDLMVRGIVGINPEERRERQDILLNVTLWADTRPAAASDDIADAVNYRTVAKAMIRHIEQGQPLLVERLAAELTDICFTSDARIQAVEMAVEKVGALRFARSVGVTIFRRRSAEAG
jgi:dihydroneopterin aldolase/D-erythro-7,8-dihydroneopterin triphosphate epimerase